MTTIRQQIIDALAVKLKLIDGTDPYVNDVGSRVYEWARNPGNEAQTPFIIIDENRELYSAGPVSTPANTMSRRLGIVLEGWTYSPQNRSAPARTLLGDVERAVLSDHTLGNLATDIILIGNEWIASEEHGDRAGFLLELEIAYRTPHTTPDTPIP